MEADHHPSDTKMKQLELRFDWSEGAIGRVHTQLVEKLPFRYTINVGGQDHPVMAQLVVKVADRRENIKYGYSDDKDVAAEKFIPTWQSIGKNLAIGKKYTLSHSSKTTWDAGDPDGTKLTYG